MERSVSLYSIAIMTICGLICVLLYNGIRTPSLVEPVPLSFLGEHNRYQSFSIPHGGKIYFTRSDITADTLPREARCRSARNGVFSEAEWYPLDCLWRENEQWWRADVPVNLPPGDVASWQFDQSTLRLVPIHKTFADINDLRIIGIALFGLMAAITGLGLYTQLTLARITAPRK
jgi:hypothetical protein